MLSSNIQNNFSHIKSLESLNQSTKKSSQLNKKFVPSNCKIALTLTMVFLPFGNSYMLPLTKMLTKPATYMQISSIPQIKPVNTKGNWNKLYDQNTNLYQQTLSSRHLMNKNYQFTNSKDSVSRSSQLQSDPFVIPDLIDNHNPDANVLVLTGTSSSQDGQIYIDKYNTENDDRISAKCNNLRDYSDQEFLKNQQNNYKNVLVVDLDNQQQDSKYSDMSESESVGCLKRIIFDKKFGNISSIVFAWAKSEQTKSLLDAIQSIDCDVQKSKMKDNENENEFKGFTNQNQFYNKISQIQRIYELAAKEKNLIKREQDASIREDAVSKRQKESVRREKYVVLNLDYDESNFFDDQNEIKIVPKDIKRADDLDRRVANILNREIELIKREEILIKKEENVLKRELETILIDYNNKHQQTS